MHPFILSQMYKVINLFLYLGYVKLLHEFLFLRKITLLHPRSYSMIHDIFDTPVSL